MSLKYTNAHSNKRVAFFSGELLHARTVKVQQRLGLMTDSDATRDQEDKKSGSRKVATTNAETVIAELCSVCVDFIVVLLLKFSRVLLPQQSHGNLELDFQNLMTKRRMMSTFANL